MKSSEWIEFGTVEEIIMRQANDDEFAKLTSTHKTTKPY